MTDRLEAPNPLQIDLGKHVLVWVYPPCYHVLSTLLATLKMAMLVQRPLRLKLSPFVESELPLLQEVLWDGIGAWVQGKAFATFKGRGKAHE